eukprot:jgi/Phyca11/21373/fgenesh1_pg.PHYCAscaffold_93_\
MDWVSNLRQSVFEDVMIGFDEFTSTEKQSSHSIATAILVLKAKYYTDEERAFGLNLLPGSKKISSFMTDKKLSKYLKSNQEFDDVFIKLKLDKAGDKLFENPKFLAWAQYVDDFNQKHQTQNSMLPTLVRQFGGDDLSIMLEKAKQADKTYGVALRLQGEQMKLWRREGLTTDMLFKIYKLDDGATNLLENPGIKIWMSPQLQTWIRYNAAYAKQNPYAHKATLIDTLLDNFDTAAIKGNLSISSNLGSSSPAKKEFVTGLYNKYKAAA